MTTFNKFILSSLLCSVFLSAGAQTTVPQIISSTTTWNAAGSPYIVTQNVLVKSGATVNVQPGTKIRGTGNFRIIMEAGAGFEARGNKDSVVSIDTVNFEFMKGSLGHNFTTGGGAIFSYCFFKGTGMGGVQTITLAETPLLISNCRFWSTYYTIYGVNANTTAVKVRIEKSIFQGAKGNPGYVIMPNGAKTELEMDECLVTNTYGMYLASTSTITRCLFYNWISNSGFRVSYGMKKITFKCNTFRNFRASIIEMSGPYLNSEIVIVSNTFDSSENHITYGVYGSSPLGKFVAKNNNFLHFSKNSIKVGGGSTPGYADTLVFTKNYWGTTNVSKITAGIWDISDDITIAGLVDYANYKSALITDCIEDETVEPFVGGSASIKNASSNSFNVYPNPADGFVQIQSAGAPFTSYKIFYVNGQLMQSGNFQTSDNLINTASIAPGIYMLQVENAQLTGLKKLVITR